MSIQGSNVTVRGSKISKIGRRVGNDTHTEALGIEKTSQSGNIHDIVIDGNVFANPPGQWNDPADGGRAWEGAPFWVFFFGMNTPTYTNITFTNNVFGDGVDRVWDQNPGPGVVLGKRIVYNNLFLLGSDQLEDAWTWKNNIFAANPAFLNSGTVADHNLYVSPLAKPSSQPNSKSTTQGLAQLFVNPNVSAATRWGLDADWHLKAGSAAIDMPGIVDGNSPLVDASGSPRSGTPDVGPSQFGASTPDTTPPTVMPDGSGQRCHGLRRGHARRDSVRTPNQESRASSSASTASLSGTAPRPLPTARTWNASSASIGAHTVQAKAFNGAGLSSASSVSVTVQAPAPDTTPPTRLPDLAGYPAPPSPAASPSPPPPPTPARASPASSSAPTACSWAPTQAPPTPAPGTPRPPQPGSHTILATAYDVAGNSANSSVAVSVQAAPPAPGGTNVASAANGGSVLGFSSQFDERALASYVIDGKKAYNAFYTAWWVKAPAASEYVTVGFDTTSLVELRQRGQRRRLRRPHGGPVLLGRRRHLEADRHLLRPRRQRRYAQRQPHHLRPGPGQGRQVHGV